MVTRNGLVVHFRTGAPQLRVTGSQGEMTFEVVEGVEAVAEHGHAGRQAPGRGPLAAAGVRGGLTAACTR